MTVKYRPPAPPRATPNKPRVAATCIGCGHKGKSQYPDHYLCTVCYHERHAEACDRKVEQLKARIEKIEREAIYHRGMAGKPLKGQEDREPPKSKKPPS